VFSENGLELIDILFKSIWIFVKPFAAVQVSRGRDLSFHRTCTLVIRLRGRRNPREIGTAQTDIASATLFCGATGENIYTIVRNFYP
jgi:hypothetical protein